MLWAGLLGPLPVFGWDDAGGVEVTEEASGSVRGSRPGGGSTDCTHESGCRPARERCGDGVLQEGEACGAGANNGTPDCCDAECGFVCQGECPLRVDPSIRTPGDGSSWKRALADIGSALARVGDAGRR